MSFTGPVKPDQLGKLYLFCDIHSFNRKGNQPEPFLEKNIFMSAFFFFHSSKPGLLRSSMKSLSKFYFIYRSKAALSGKDQRQQTYVKSLDICLTAFTAMNYLHMN